jgi:phage shock protein A
MAHQIRMPPPVGAWAAGFMARVSSAWHNGAAPSEARRVLGKVGFWIAGPGLDAAYQRQLVALTRARRAVASVATSRKRLELQIGELERKGGQHEDPASTSSGASPGGPADPSRTSGGVGEQLADLHRQYADLQAKEERVTAASRRLMAEVNAFRTGIAATKAAYAAAEEAAEGMWAEISRDLELGRAGQHE